MSVYDYSNTLTTDFDSYTTTDYITYNLRDSAIEWTITNPTTDTLIFVPRLDGPAWLNSDITWTYETTDTSSYGGDFVIASNFLNRAKLLLNKSNLTYSKVTFPQTAHDMYRIDLLGNTLIDYVSVSQRFLTVQMQGHDTKQFSLELEDRVTVTIDALSIDADYRVCGIKYKTLSTPQDVITTLHLYPVLEP